MSSLASTPFLLRGAFVALLAAVALSGLAGLGPGEPGAEAAFSAEVKKLLASDGEAGNNFGLNLSISGDIAMIEMGKAGLAHVYERDAGGSANWGEVAILTSADGDTTVRRHVAVSGDTAVVGATFQPAGTSELGVALIFQRDQGGAGNWGEVKMLMPSEYSGRGVRSVAISGDVAIVARPDRFGPVPNGEAWLFERDAGGTDNWGEVGKLIGSDPTDLFGDSLAIAGDTAFVGARLEDEAGNDAGAVYVFERDQGGAGNWGEVKKLIGSDTDANDEFGASVAVSADTLVVGAKFADLGLPPPGAAYVFERNQGGAGNWGEVKKLTASDADWLDRFGVSVSVDGDTIVVGAGQEDEAAANAGAVYVYKRDQVAPGTGAKFRSSRLRMPLRATSSDRA